MNVQHQEIQSLLHAPELQAQPTRRLALQSALGVGYAAAAMPLMAQTAIKTSGEGLLQGEVTIEVQGFKMPAYRSMPAGARNCPVVLVISEVFGVHEYIADVTRRLAHAGYMAIAPELFVRQGDPSEYGELAKLFAEIINKVPDAQVMGDLDACVQWAASQGGDVKRLGITGFCWGGRITWLYAMHNPQLRAAVAWYGRLTGDKTTFLPSHPLDQATALKAPTLGLYAGQDAGISQASVDAMKAALAAQKSNAAAQGSSFVVYPGVPHAFHADYRPSYREREAKDGWQRMLDWFRRHGLA